MAAQIKRKFLRKGILLPLGAAVLLVVVVGVASLQLLTPKGWSRDVVFDDGQMKMRVQHKLELDPTTAGKVNLMVKVKDAGGYLMRVDHVHFTVTEGGEKVVDGLEGEPTGTFKIGSDSFYLISLEVVLVKAYQVAVEIAHQQSSFNLTFPFKVKAEE